MRKAKAPKKLKKIKLKKETLKMEVLDFRERGVHYLVRAKINGKNARMLVDTGASSSVMDRNMTSKFKIQGTVPIHKELQKMVTAGDSTPKLDIYKLKKLSLGAIVIKNTPISAIDLSHIQAFYQQFSIPPIDGIIGMDIIKGYQAILDFKKDEMRLQGVDIDGSDRFNDTRVFKKKKK